MQSKRDNVKNKTMDRFHILWKHQVETTVLQKMIETYQCVDSEETFAQFRILVRTFHTCIESLLSIMKTESLTAHNEGRVKFSDNDLEMLTGSKSKKRGSGKMPKKVKFIKNARITVRLFDEATGGPTKEGKSYIQIPSRASEWSSLRNRITHPKTLDDFDIHPSDAEIAKIVAAWYMGLSSWVIATEKRAAATRNKERKAIIAEMQARSVDGVIPPRELEGLRKRLQNTLE